MSGSIRQFLEFLKSLPMSKKISIAFVLMLLVTGFSLMFIWANQTDYKVLFSNLSPEDGGAVVSKLKERNVPFKVTADGTGVMVPAEEVYELRLALAGEGLPQGGNVGFEIFDNTDFRTTKFVQELNYRRALQGELARTINQFKEVKSSKVFIVLPKESLFIEESRPSSASIQLDLKSSLQPNKLTAIVHLTANAVEGLEPENVTVVDTKGRVIFEGGQKEEGSTILSGTQLDYQGKMENEIRNSVQTMLEGIVGIGKAIVRVHAEIDFNNVTLNQEEYDPSSAAVRSQKAIEESTAPIGSDKGTVQTTNLDQRRGVIDGTEASLKPGMKKNITTNYEINKITKTIYQPAGKIKRLSVAAVIDGRYEWNASEDGTTKQQYVPRNDEELRKFEEMVKRAMGYDEDREDQVSVSSMAFSDASPEGASFEAEDKGFNIQEILKNQGKTLLNLFLVALVFLLVVRPLLKSLKSMRGEPSVPQAELPPVENEQAQIPEASEMGPREKVLEMTKVSPDRTIQLIRGWLSEQE